MGSKGSDSRKLVEFLERAPSEKITRKVTLLPDLFIDQIISIPKTSRGFLSDARKILTRGGGNYTGVSTRLTVGGCAANCASALSRLHVPTGLISRTSEIGCMLLFLNSDVLYLDLSYVSTHEKPALTAALETRNARKVSNLMLTDPGPAGNFSPDDLCEKDYELFKESFIVGLFSWNLNEHGTDLFARVATFCSEKHVQTYLDLGDPTPRIGQLPRLIQQVLRKGLVNYLSLNENELRLLSRVLGLRKWRTGPAKELARRVAEELPLELDLHTSDYAGYAKGNKAAFWPTFDVAVRRTTGAGDAWNAGNIFGLIREAEPGIRLMTANLLAAMQVSHEEQRHDSLEELARYGKNSRQKAIEDLS